MADFFETEIAVQDAKAIAFDGCHKIYVLMDDAQVEKMRGYGYGDDDGSYLITADKMSKAEMLDTLENWFADSCSLRFINAVSTVAGDPNEGFTDLIPQGADWQEDEDDYDDPDHYGDEDEDDDDN